LDAKEALAHRLQTATRVRLKEAGPLLLGVGKRLPGIDILCNLRGQSAGQVRWPARGRVQIRYNLAMAQQQPEAFERETVPHEVAHVVTKVLHPNAKPHGPEWQAIMSFFGVDPKRCHDFTPAESPSRRQRQWRYRCDCREHQLSTTRHHRDQRGQSRYHCRECGGELRWAEVL
jgi:SprT protein